MAPPSRFHLESYGWSMWVWDFDIWSETSASWFQYLQKGVYAQFLQDTNPSSVWSNFVQHFLLNWELKNKSWNMRKHADEMDRNNDKSKFVNTCEQIMTI